MNTALLPSPAGQADPVVQATRALSIASLLGLIVLGLAWELVLAPTGNRTLVLKVVPLLFPLVGLLKHRLYTHRWVSLLVWLYFTEGVVRATSDPYPSWVLALVEVILCLVLFTASALHVRWRLKQAKARGALQEA
ncbi:MAG: DUF2069 domain-containing protein [Betaproteobacteria bacterium]|nr:DUF2069 domain-containing protein [Betaproteobacteria bacterium]NBT09783.1 DUF2069 domain-containing protein [Betaproteobacteria bacterium]NBX96568.1 DUF2069 domain-containing protein [Betaproteobacteria bacterium]